MKLGQNLNFRKIYFQIAGMEKNAIIAVGNPGAGKSTTLNYLAGEVLFESGDSFGGGLTSQLNVGVSKDNVVFYDTPGLADISLRKAAGKAISELGAGSRARNRLQILHHCPKYQIWDC